MKKLIIFAILVVTMSFTAGAQTFKAPEKQKIEFTDTTTTFKYEISGEIYDVYVSKNGAYYIWKKRESKPGKYKMYIPKEIQKKMGRKYDNKKKEEK